MFALRARRAAQPQSSLLLRRFLATPASIPQTYVEKVVQRHAVGLPEGKVVKAGDYVMIKPQHVMTHDNTGPVISKFKSIGATKISNPRQTVFTLDHDVQNRSQANLSKYARIEAFAGEHDVDFYPAGRGIGHQIMIEEGYAFPGVMTVASDSHSNMYGGVGCVGTAIVRTDAAALWATQRTWWQVPPIVRVNLEGELPAGVTGKDIIIALCGGFNKDEVLNHAIEFHGSGIPQLSVDERLAIANMTTEWGALVGVFPVDNVLKEWYESQLKKLELRRFQLGGGSSSSASLASTSSSHPRLTADRLASVFSTPLLADEGASYAKTLTLDLTTLSPSVAGPNSVKISTPLPALEKDNIKINKAYLVSCTNSRLSDIKAAADVIRGKKVAPGVEFYIAAASSVVQKEAEASGDWAALVGAGAKVLPAGCGPCIGLGVGLLEDGEVGISATNRNYKGRMGSPNALAYLASPEVVAASAVAGKIVGPKVEGASPSASPPSISISVNSPAAASSSSSASEPAAAPVQEPLLPNFPPLFAGPLLFAPQDNLNTDGIYPGKYTYQDDITREKQADVVMENYDPSFAATMKSLKSSSPASSGEGVLLAAGYNFGTGSSREQAATALLSSGVPLVLCGSFGDIFKRNSINNALICVECPDLIEDLTREFGKDGKRNAGAKGGELTVKTPWWVEVESVGGVVRLRKEKGGEVVREYKVGAVGGSVQEMWLAGGLEGWVRERI
ncbi:hypothetical protein JCM6882_007113 [Rhodosporidiobolus microsporus]